LMLIAPLRVGSCSTQQRTHNKSGADAYCSVAGMLPLYPTTQPQQIWS
jgi:hypothetical protein